MSFPFATGQWRSERGSRSLEDAFKRLSDLAPLFGKPVPCTMLICHSKCLTRLLLSCERLFFFGLFIIFVLVLLCTSLAERAKECMNLMGEHMQGDCSVLPYVHGIHVCGGELGLHVLHDGI